jgi:hypothetical protein
MKTCEVVKLVGRSYWAVIGAIRAKKVPPPVKDASGDYLWTPLDIERLRAAFALDRRRGTRRRAAS